MNKRIVQVEKAKFACDGGTTSSHPQVWLQIDKNLGHTNCPYCDTKFIYVGKSDH